MSKHRHTLIDILLGESSLKCIQIGTVTNTVLGETCSAQDGSDVTQQLLAGFATPSVAKDQATLSMLAMTGL